MSTYNHSRRAPNVSQYIANLNTIPTSQDLAAQNDFDLASDGLDFLNTEFFDFDASTFEQQQQQANHAEIHSAVPASATTEAYPYPDYRNFAQPSYSQSPSTTQSPPAHVQPAFQQAAFEPATGDKRKALVAQISPIGDLEDESRAAAEEDKRRRNTAASARFRVKKKQREQALEKQAKEMSDKVKALENKVTQLEMENKWLKGLITEKSDGKNVSEQFANFDSKTHDDKEVDSSTDARNDGVGTKDIKA